MRHDLLGTVISQRDDAAAIFHERRSSPGERDQRIDADIVGNAKAFTGSLHKIVLEFRSWSEADAVNKRVNLAVALLQFRKDAIDFFILGHIAHERFRTRKRENQI